MSRCMRPGASAVPRIAGAAALLVASLLVGVCAQARAAHASPPPAACPGASLSKVTVSPLPGTPEASPQTQISFLGLQARRLRSISVIGSITGRHPGSLRSYRSATGVSFLPYSQFAAGEHVSVCASVRTRRGSRLVATSFQVAVGARLRYEPPFELPGTRGDAQTYHSVDLKPPRITIERELESGSQSPAQPGSPTGSGLAALPGYIFATPYAGPAEHGALIFESSGRLIWFHRPPEPDWGIANLKLASWNGRQDLVWWQGMINTFGFGRGEDVVANQAYEIVARVRGGNGLQADLHDVQFTPSGAAFITAYYPVWTSVPIPGRHRARRSAVVLDSAVQEIDVKTGLVMWEWQSLGHVPLTQSHLKPPRNPGSPYDYFHLDSLQQLPDGKLLICARNVWGVYAIRPHTGRLAWRLGTSHSSLTLGFGVRFGWPEGAQLLPGDQLAIYDGGAASAASPRGEIANLEWASGTISLASGGQLSRGGLGTRRAPGQGSLQQLASGDWLIGWAGLPNFTEYDSEGNVLYDARFPSGEVGYRAYREPWQGQPSLPPNVVTSTTSAGTTAYVSWNGATGVTAWRLLGGSSRATLEVIETVPNGGFETTIVTPRSVPYVELQALGASGEVLGESKVLPT